MKFLLSLIIVSICLFSNELEDIESIIKTSTIEFKEAKETQDIKKLTSITKKLYDNHKHIKKLKQKLQSKEPITFLCNDTPCEKAVLQIGDKLTVVFNLSFDDSEEYEKSILKWQLQNGKKIIENKTKEIYEKGGFKKFENIISIDESFKEGKYTIAMHHKKNSETVKGKAFFKVEKPLEVKNIVVSTLRDATSSDSGIYYDETFYILSGFTLSNPKDKISIDLKLKDTTKGITFIDKTIIRPKEDNHEKKQLLRFKIPASKLYKKQILNFSMKLYSDTINPITKQITIPIKGYRLSVSAPSSLKSGRSGKYKISVPKKFVKPFKVDISPSGGILLSHKKKLSGTIEAINKNNEYGSIYVSVTDTNGKKASTKVSIKLTIKQEEAYVNEDTNKNSYTPIKTRPTKSYTQPTYTKPKVKKIKTLNHGDIKIEDYGKGCKKYSIYKGYWLLQKIECYYSNGQLKEKASNCRKTKKRMCEKNEYWKSNGNRDLIREYTKEGYRRFHFFDNGKVSLEGMEFYNGDKTAINYYKNGSKKSILYQLYSKSSYILERYYDTGKIQKRQMASGINIKGIYEQKFHVTKCSSKPYTSSCSYKYWNKNGTLIHDDYYSKQGHLEISFWSNGKKRKMFRKKHNGDTKFIEYNKNGTVTKVSGK